jgi:hypothetical protein
MATGPTPKAADIAGKAMFTEASSETTSAPSAARATGTGVY